MVLRDGVKEELDFGMITQEDEKESQDNWQVPYDEQLVNRSTEKMNYIFFFHYLDFSKPLLTPAGSLELIEITPIPDHLADIKYDPPY